MSTFTKWLVDKGHISSEDKDTIESELSGPEADELFQIFIDEGNTNTGWLQ